MFDRIQKAHLTECRNIADTKVLMKCAVDVDRFISDLKSARVDRMVKEDLKKARKFGINGVPTLVIDGKYIVQGAVYLETLESTFEQLVEAGEMLTHLPGLVSILDRDRLY